MVRLFLGGSQVGGWWMSATEYRWMGVVAVAYMTVDGCMARYSDPAQVWAGEWVL